MISASLTNEVTSFEFPPWHGPGCPVSLGGWWRRRSAVQTHTEIAVIPVALWRKVSVRAWGTRGGHGQDGAPTESTDAEDRPQSPRPSARSGAGCAPLVLMEDNTQEHVEASYIASGWPGKNAGGSSSRAPLRDKAPVLGGGGRCTTVSQSPLILAPLRPILFKKKSLSVHYWPLRPTSGGAQECRSRPAPKSPKTLRVWTAAPQHRRRRLPEGPSRESDEPDNNEQLRLV